jgi:hypothetical protein
MAVPSRHHRPAGAPAARLASRPLHLLPRSETVPPPLHLLGSQFPLPFVSPSSRNGHHYWSSANLPSILHLPPSGPIKGAPHPRPTPSRSSSLPSLHLLSPSASHTERHHWVLLLTAARLPHHPSAWGEPATRVPTPPSCLPCLHSKPPCPGAAAGPSSGELQPAATVRSTVDPWTSHPCTVYRPWTRSTVFLFKNKSKSNKFQTLASSPLSFPQIRI